ncbi:MAG: hypothetical protein QOG26_1099 [Solirubrobacterales bacterium]|nr:hypothetical protein [Solirubrobacterales bacterium]
MALRTQARFPEVALDKGHYESFYIKAASPRGGLGVWIRHTVHKRPGEEPTASIWFTLFDAEAEGPTAAKVTLPKRELAADGETYIRVDGASLADGRAEGALHAGGVDASWELSFADDAEPFYFLPRPWMYRTPIPRTKFLSPYPDARFSGRLTVDGRTIELDDWPGMVGHNWGSEHAERWVWLQGAGFADRPRETYFDAGGARIKLGPLTLPWIANGRLVLDGHEHRLGGIERIRSTDIREQPASCDFVLHGSDVVVKGRVWAEAKDFVGWVYADPAGPEHHTLNCSISNMDLHVERTGRPAETLALRGGAAYEFGSRDFSHGIPIQPFPDG